MTASMKALFLWRYTKHRRKTAFKKWLWSLGVSAVAILSKTRTSMIYLWDMTASMKALFLWRYTKHRRKTAFKKRLWRLGVFAFAIMLLWNVLLSTKSHVTTGAIEDFHVYLDDLQNGQREIRPNRSKQQLRADDVFVRGLDGEMYVYSAISTDYTRNAIHRDAQRHSLLSGRVSSSQEVTSAQEVRSLSSKTSWSLSSPRAVTVVVTTLHRSDSSEGFRCCVVGHGGRVLDTPAGVFYEHDRVDGVLKLQQFSCNVPASFPLFYSVTLVSRSRCPRFTRSYVRVELPVTSTGLGLCGKVIHGAPDPHNLIAWMEMQKLLGVDKVMLYSLNISPEVSSILRHYEAEGFVSTKPYVLPGEPSSRSLTESYKRTPQFTHDEELAVHECRLRLGGYSLLLSHDIDELVVPRGEVARPAALKTLLKNSFAEYPLAAGFYFLTEFFITDRWQPTDNSSSVLYARYHRCTFPSSECHKFVVRPHRVRTFTTHTIQPRALFTTPYLPASAAILHHYRHCPDTWRTCRPDTIVDNTMSVYTPELTSQVNDVTTTLGLHTGTDVTCE